MWFLHSHDWRKTESWFFNELILIIFEFHNLASVLYKLASQWQKYFSFQTTALHDAVQKVHYQHFSDSELIILWKRFEKNRFIGRREAEDLARVFNVYPDKILHWFAHQRFVGGLRAMEKTIEGKHFLTLFNVVSFCHPEL